MELTKEDFIELEKYNGSYFLKKGADYYQDGVFNKAVEYYRIAASLGVIEAISNLGYCYMYSRGIEKNMSLAVAYFTMASLAGDVDSTYKLGNIYMKGYYGEKDPKKGIQFYQGALEIVKSLKTGFGDQIEISYPSLYFSYAKELISGEHVRKNLKLAKKYLIIAKNGYEKEIKMGTKFYQSVYDDTLELLNDETFKDI